MPLYFFDTSDGEDCVRDDTGVDLPDFEAVRNEAIKALPDIARDVLPDGDRRSMTVSVRDEAQRQVFKARLTFETERLEP